jgi:ATP-dependent DNA helicase PIF1
MATLATLDELSDEQRIAFDKFKRGENLFITGSGGTGKSKLIQEFVKYSNDSGKCIQVCALTGCAAVLLENCNAITIHSFSGIGYMNVPDDKILDKVYRNFRVKKMWKEVDILVIDEVSMMSKRMFELLEKIGRMLRKKTGFFGGIQVIFTGDFFQLPPIGEESKDTEFCFESEHWFDVFTTNNHIELTKIFRQTDQKYIDILSKIRRGILDEESIQSLSQCINKPVNNAHAITQLFPLKSKVETVNRVMFSKIREDSKVFNFEFNFNNNKYLNDNSQIEQSVLQRCNDLNEEFKQREMEKILVSYNFVKCLELKVGSVVMCTKNICIEAGICNGSQGIIEEIRSDGPLVRFNNGIIQVINKIWVQSTEYPTITVCQIPICLAWAITIHKIQGITLDNAMIDVGNTVFEYGQTYVALSRIKSLDGLHLINFDAKKIKANPKVIEFYNHMKDERETKDLVMLPPQTNTVGGTARRSSAEASAGAAAIRRNERVQTIAPTMPTQNISSFFQKKEKNNNPDDDCPICLNKFKDASCTTQCGHRYCAECLTKHWKSKKGILDCPYCRQRITMLVPN